MIYEPCSMACVGLSEQERNGGCCPTICRHGIRSINKPDVGSPPVSLKIWYMTCEPWFDWQKARKNNLRQPFSMVAPFNLHPKVEKEQATTATNDRKAAISILPWTPWDCCWLRMSHRLMNRSALRSRSWLKRYMKQLNSLWK